MDKTKLTALTVTFAITAILCSCTDADQPGSQPDSVVTVTSAQTSDIQTSSETPVTLPSLVSSAQASQTATAKQNVSFSQVGDFKKMNIPENVSYLSDLTPVSDKLICGWGGICDKYGNCSYDKICLIDISSGEFTTVSLPDKIDREIIRSGSDDILCVMDWDRWDYADDMYKTITGYHKSVLKIKKDYSLEMNEDCSMSDIAFDFNGHKICEWNESIYELNSGEEKKIVEGVPLEYELSKNGKLCSFLFGIDENRFAYKVLGYEIMHGLGVYDFSSGTNTFLTDTMNQEPIGTYDGKIYSVSSALGNECESKIYVTDIDTMTTSTLTDLWENGVGADVKISMSEDGRRIAAVINRYNDDYTCTPELSILDSSDGHIIKSYDISSLDTTEFNAKFIDNTTIDINGRDHYIIEIE